MLVNPKDLLLTKDDLVESVIFYKDKNGKVKRGIIKLFDNKENVFILDNQFLLKGKFKKINKEVDLYFLEKFVPCKKQNKIIESKLDFDFRYSEHYTNLHRKELRKKIKTKKDILLAGKRMSKAFNKNYFIRVFNISGKLVSYVNILDSYFIGFGFKLKFGNRLFSGKYWFIDQKNFIDNLKNDKDFFEHMLFIQEMFEEISISNINIYFIKRSPMFLLMKKVKENKKEFKKWH